MPRVRERREQLRVAFTQYHLARLTAIPQSRISLIERGLVEPKADERERIAQALACPQWELWPPDTSPPLGEVEEKQGSQNSTMGEKGK